jgi:galactoside O-acetyltransferase
MERSEASSPKFMITASSRAQLNSFWWGLSLEAKIKYAGGELIRTGNISFQHPVSFSGKGTLFLGKNVTFGFWQAGSRRNPIVIQPRESGSEIVIGDDTFVVNGCEFFALASVRIGANCLIGSRCTIMDSDFHDIDPDRRNSQGITAPVIVEDNVWFGSDVTVLKGVRIGRDPVLAAHCVVVKSVPPGSIVAGNPMRIVGSVYERKKNGRLRTPVEEP